MGRSSELASRRPQSESYDDALWTHREDHLEAIDPLCLGDAAAEGGLAGEEALAAGPHPNDGWYESGV